jgi:hypothetical protein
MDIRGLAERTESDHYQFLTLIIVCFMVSVVPRSVDGTHDPPFTSRNMRSGNERRKKNKFFFSAATPLAARPPFLPKNDPTSIAYLPDRIFPKIHATKNKIYFFINFIL